MNPLENLFDRALKALQTALALKTGTATAEEAARVLRVLGRVCHVLGRDEEAARELRMADKAGP